MRQLLWSRRIQLGLRGICSSVFIHHPQLVNSWIASMSPVKSIALRGKSPDSRTRSQTETTALVLCISQCDLHLSFLNYCHAELSTRQRDPKLAHGRANLGQVVQYDADYHRFEFSIECSASPPTEPMPLTSLPSLTDAVEQRLAYLLKPTASLSSMANGTLFDRNQRSKSKATDALRAQYNSSAGRRSVVPGATRFRSPDVDV